MSGTLQVGSYTFHSRLIVGTGKYETNEMMRDAISESETELVTVALRRVNLDNPGERSLLDFIPANVRILPNTAGCYTTQEALNVARLAKAAGIGTLVKLEIIGDRDLLWPDPLATLEATKILVQEGFTVMVYTTGDPVLAKYLDEAGAHAIMPLGSPIGSGQGVLDVEAISRFKRRVSVPVIVDAGIGSPEDACLAMESGADGVLINTAIAQAKNPGLMARAMKLAVESGRLGFEAGRMPKRGQAVPSSPSSGMMATGR